MLKRLFFVLSFLVIQISSNAQAQNYPGYKQWDTKVKEYVGCGSNNTNCLGTFIRGKYVIKISTPCIYSMCPQTPGETIVGNDAIEVYQTFVSRYSQWTNKTDIPRLEFSAGPTSSDVPNLSFTFTIHSADAEGYTNLLGSDPVNLTCNMYVEGLGCADDNLDRTSMTDGPCEICSKIGNPFDVRNGAKYEHAVDLDFPIVLSRNYSSRERVYGMFGTNWRSNFDKKLQIVQNGGIITSLIFTPPTGEYIILQSNDGINFTPFFQDQKQYKVIIANGQIKLTRPDSGIEFYNLSNGKIVSEIYKGKTLNYQYNSYGLISRVVDQFGRYLEFFYSNYANVVEQVYASSGDYLTYTYDSGNVATIRVNNIVQITYQYDENGRLSGKLDPNGVQYASFTYDALGRGIENKWISNGHEIKKYTVSYTNSYNNNQTTVSQSNGFSRTYNMSNFDFAKKITSMNWNGKSEQAVIDNHGNVTSRTDLDGINSIYGYDNDGRVNNYQTGGQITNINWSTDYNIPYQIQQTTANGLRNIYNFFDANGNDLGVKATGSGSEKYVYKTRDSYGRLTREENEKGLVKNYTYYPINTSTNENALLKSIVSNTGEAITINSYDTRGNATSITVNGVTKTMTYDYKGRVLTETVNGATNTYTYDIDGNMITSQMATGYQMNMTYDTAGRLLSMTDNMGGKVTLELDDNTNEVLNTSIYQNNTLVRARNKIIDSLGRTTQTWNATNKTRRFINYSTKASMPDSTTDANGITTSYGWNTEGLMSSYMSGNDNSSNAYDIDGNLTSVNANGQTTTMTYDSLGRIASMNSPDSGGKTFSYSQNEDSYTDSKGTIHKLTRGIGGLPVSFMHLNNDPEFNYNNFETYNYDNYGRLNKITTNNSETMYNRNNLGQLTSKTINISALGIKAFTVNYTYDAAGQKISDTYPSGLVVSYGYTNGFVTSISVNGTPVVNNIQYNSILKEPTAWILGGNQVSMNKDSDGLLKSFIDSGTFNQNIGTDNEGHILSMNDSVSYYNFNVVLDQNYALSSGTISGFPLNYSYDNNHNATIQKDGFTNFEFEYQNGNNKMESLWLGGSNTHFDYQYDGNGNLRKNQHGEYQYDGKNRLEYFYDNNRNITRYFYDGLNQRVAKWSQSQGGQIRYFVYNENNQLIGEYDSNGNAIAEYIYFGLRPVAVKNGSNINIVHTDYLGTPRVITSGTGGGSIVWLWENINPYGNNIAFGSVEFNLRFTGQYYDSESGLNYNINRYYDPESGRYIQSDPLGLSAGFNTYNYVNRNPISSVDPLGLKGKNVLMVNLYPTEQTNAPYIKDNMPDNTLVIIVETIDIYNNTSEVGDLSKVQGGLFGIPLNIVMNNDTFIKQATNGTLPFDIYLKTKHGDFIGYTPYQIHGIILKLYPDAANYKKIMLIACNSATRNSYTGRDKNNKKSKDTMASALFKQFDNATEMWAQNYFFSFNNANGFGISSDDKNYIWRGKDFDNYEEIMTKLIK